MKIWNYALLDLNGDGRRKLFFLRWVWDTFVADRQSATKEEYLEAQRRQDEKPDAVWHDFTEENIEAEF